MSKTILNRNMDVEIKGIKSDFFKIASEYKHLQSLNNGDKYGNIILRWRRASQTLNFYK